VSRVLVLGAAVSGTAAARLARRVGHEVAVYDHRPEVVEVLAGEGFPASAGEWSAPLLEGSELVVASPGFPEWSAPIQDALAAGLPVWSEIELAFRHLDAAVLAVTGTNGKTTVASLVADMLAGSGRKAVAAGNIGLALSDLVGEPWDTVVVEASSFQLRFIDRFRPGVAVILNVAPDHLDWHGSLEAYSDAKARVFSNQSPSDVLVYDADDPGAAALSVRAPSRLAPVSGTRVPKGGAGASGPALRFPAFEVSLEGLPVPDPAYLVDLAAAGMAALHSGATSEAVGESIRRFRPGPHRRSVVGTWEDVTWVDDSKATNPHAAVAAARAYPAVILLAGGRNKGLDLRPLAEVPSVRHVVAFGEAGPELVEAAGPGRVTMVGTVEEAVALADGLARRGDTVLLAPACASFDMYRSYAERGEAFAQAVRARKGGLGGHGGPEPAGSGPPPTAAGPPKEGRGGLGGHGGPEPSGTGPPPTAAGPPNKKERGVEQ
jgi:UDP-N-acetylmuramoylalanine--D-glutamate ligase